jgi:hypothetical protein
LRAVQERTVRNMTYGSLRRVKRISVFGQCSASKTRCVDAVGGSASGEGRQGRAFYQFGAPYRIRAAATRATAIRCACDDAI